MTWTDTASKRIYGWQAHEEMLTSLAIMEIQIKIMMRCQCAPIRMAKIKNTENIKSWQGCWTTGVLTHCYGNAKWYKPFQKTVSQCLTL